MPRITLYKWQRLGWVQSRQVTEALGRLALWADEEERERLRQLRLFKRQWPTPRYPAALTTPKTRPQRGGQGMRGMEALAGVACTC